MLCGIAIAAVLFVPLWKIDLVAPQYPEGLSLLIYPHKLGGNVDIINGLNHYIGMKTLRAEDFTEFAILPYLIGSFALLFMAAAIVGKRRFMNITFFLFVAFGVVAMVDFWKWEYDYGHNLNPDAAIRVPGMSYQPPLIGYKQLLNFSAYSMPDTGGWLFVGAGAIALLCVVTVSWNYRKAKQVAPKAVAAALVSTLIMLVSCSTGPQPLRPGRDHCDFCKMTITDSRFGTELVTKKGRIFKFDDVHCLLSYLKVDKDLGGAADVYVARFDGAHELLKVQGALLYASADLRSPMGGNVAAFMDAASLQQFSGQYPGKQVSWKELIK